VTTLFYLVAKAAGAPTAMIEVQKLLSLFEIAPVNRPVLEGAATLSGVENCSFFSISKREVRGLTPSAAPSAS
jgi:hypothetical protein